VRVLVCGGRDYSDAAFVNWVLDKVHKKLKITCIIHGCARGADTFGAEWAERQTLVTSYGVPADWKTYGTRAGPVRNGLMLSHGKPQLVIAFDGGSGTAHMVKISEERGVKVIQADKFKGEYLASRSLQDTLESVQ
jgi:hypothetical protein